MHMAVAKTKHEEASAPPLILPGEHFAAALAFFVISVHSR